MSGVNFGSINSGITACISPSSRQQQTSRSVTPTHVANCESGVPQVRSNFVRHVPGAFNAAAVSAVIETVCGVIKTNVTDTRRADALIAEVTSGGVDRTVTNRLVELGVMQAAVSHLISSNQEADISRPVLEAQARALENAIVTIARACQKSKAKTCAYTGDPKDKPLNKAGRAALDVLVACRGAVGGERLVDAINEAVVAPHVLRAVQALRPEVAQAWERNSGDVDSQAVLDANYMRGGEQVVKMMAGGNGRDLANAIHTLLKQPEYVNGIGAGDPDGAGNKAGEPGGPGGAAGPGGPGGPGGVAGWPGAGSLSLAPVYHNNANADAKAKSGDALGGSGRDDALFKHIGDLVEIIRNERANQWGLANGKSQLGSGSDTTSSGFVSRADSVRSMQGIGSSNSTSAGVDAGTQTEVDPGVGRRGSWSSESAASIDFPGVSGDIAGDAASQSGSTDSMQDAASMTSLDAEDAVFRETLAALLEVPTWTDSDSFRQAFRASELATSSVVESGLQGASADAIVVNSPEQGRRAENADMPDVAGFDELPVDDADGSNPFPWDESFHGSSQLSVPKKPDVLPRTIASTPHGNVDIRQRSAQAATPERASSFTRHAGGSRGASVIPQDADEGEWARFVRLHQHDQVMGDDPGAVTVKASMLKEFVGLNRWRGEDAVYNGIVAGDITLKGRVFDATPRSEPEIARRDTLRREGARKLLEPVVPLSRQRVQEWRTNELGLKPGQPTWQTALNQASRPSGETSSQIASGDETDSVRSEALSLRDLGAGNRVGYSVAGDPLGRRRSLSTDTASLPSQVQSDASPVAATARGQGDTSRPVTSAARALELFRQRQRIVSDAWLPSGGAQEPVQAGVG